MSAQLLPLFPLEICAFEQETVRLHIFENRYKLLINTCIEQETLFGIPVLKKEGLQGIGSAMEITALKKKYEGGEMDIECRVKFTFDLEDFIPASSENHYASGWIKPRPYTVNEDYELNLRIYDLLSELYELSDAPKITADNKTFSMLPYLHKAALSPDQEIEMLHLSSFRDRQLYLINHLKDTIKTLTEIKKMHRLILLNGHFKKATSAF